MSDYSEHGAIPVEDAATGHPPTVDEVMERQRVEHPEQARPTPPKPSDEDLATMDAGGEPVGISDNGVEVEGPNSA